MRRRFFITLLLFSLVIPLVVHAQYPANGIVPEGCRRDPPANATCDLTDMVALVINIANLILGLVGSAALLMFIYGGFLWLSSAGSAEQVNKGKEVFLNAIKGIALIFGAWLIINFIVAALTGQTPGAGVLLFRGQDKYTAPPLEIPGG